MTCDPHLDARFVPAETARTKGRLRGLLALALGLGLQTAAHAGDVQAPADERYLVTTSRYVIDPEVPDGVLLIDPEQGLYKLLASLEGVRLGGALVLEDGTVLLVDRGRFPRPGRILRYDPRQGTVETLAEGGFLIAPTRMIRLPGGSLVVADEGPPGGKGALIQIDPIERSTHLLSFGRHLNSPQDLTLGMDGRIYALGRNILAVDPVSGVQELLPVQGDWQKGLAIDVDSNGDLLVLGRDDGVHKVLRVDPMTGTGTQVFYMLEKMRDVHAETPESFVYGQAGPVAFALARKYSTGYPEWITLGSLLHGIRSIAPFTGIDMNVGAAAAAVPPLINVHQDSRQGFQLPQLPQLPGVSILVNKDTVTLRHGEGPADDEVLPAGHYPLITALRAATPGTDPVIGIEGDIPGIGMSIGGGDSDHKAYVAHWGEVPMRFAVVGVTEDARIRDFGLRDRMNNGTKHAGVTDAWFANLTIEARSSAAVLIPKHHTFGQLRFYRVHFAAGRENLAEGAYSGYGYRWGVRGHGRGRWDFRYCSFDPVEEHAIYLDSPQGDSYFQHIEHRGSGRTAIQIVNRSIDNPGPSGHGTLLFEDVLVQRLWGDGGSGITVAGHLGDVIFRNITVTEDSEVGHSHGAIAVWTDDSKEKGTYLYTGADGDLYSTRSVTIESIDVDLPNSDRSHIAISGVEDVHIQEFDVRGNKVAFTFDSRYGTPTIEGAANVDGKLVQLRGVTIDNGRIHFEEACPLSSYPGFRSLHKIKVGEDLLDNAEINERWCSD